MKIDSHQHFWKYNQEEFGWIGDEMSRLQKDYLPDELIPILKTSGVEGTIAVQARQTLEETRWLLQLADKYPFIKGIVGWTDLCCSKVEFQLNEFASSKKLCGVRHVLHDEMDDNFMMRDDFLNGISLLKEFNLTYDLLLFPRHLPIACELVKKNPEQRFVLDHIAKPLIREGLLQPWVGNIKRLAEFPNVYCKVSGMVTENHWQKWKNFDFDPYLEVVFETFGWERIMFGSDWPVCTLAANYSEVFHIVLDYLKRRDLPGRAVEAVLGGNALNFYSLINE